MCNIYLYTNCEDILFTHDIFKESITSSQDDINA